MKKVGRFPFLFCCFLFFSVAFGRGQTVGPAVDIQPRVETFTPTGTVKDVRQVQVRFSVPMVPLGDPRVAPDPFTIQCEVEGTGRWVDSRNWVYDFTRDLQAGLVCLFELDEDLRSLEGQALEGPRRFEFTTGGVAIRGTQPYEGSEGIDEDQVFVLELDGPVDPESVKQHVYFTVDGIASRVGVREIEGETREAILKTHYRYRGGEVEHLLLLQAVTNFPSASLVRLVWDRHVRTPGGVARETDQVISFKTRSPFRASVTCRRENAQADCVPLTPVRLQFSAPVTREQAMQARLRGADDRLRSPRDENPDSEWVYQVRFDGPFPERSQFSVTIPGGIHDDAGRALVNAAEFPVQIRMAEYPPLAKFSASFGILELNADPVLPVTVRNLEPELNLEMLEIRGSISGHVFRLAPHQDRQMIEWIRKVRERSWKDRDKSVFNFPGIQQPHSFQLPKPGGPKAFEVLGIPLPQPGFYVVELESEVLGAALLGKPKPMFVPTTVLVTNLAVHLKWGLESSLVWVTSLDQGQPVPDARIEVLDCRGQPVARGVTDERGLVLLNTLPAESEVEECSYDSLDRGLLVTARLGDDFSFVHSSWNDGIEPWRFQLPTEYDSSLISAHTILDRPLFRAGETVHMKHVLRRRTTSGFGPVADTERPGTLIVQHQGSDQSYALAVEWDQAGLAESVWEIPRDARLGGYSIYFDAPDHSRRWTLGSFRVEEYRVPLMTGSIRPPSEELVAPESVTVDLHAEYLSGGPAAHLPVVFRWQVRPWSSTHFEDFEGFYFANGEVTEGIQKRGQADGEDDRPPLQSEQLTLDESGSARTEMTGFSMDDRPVQIQAELEFRDPNGEIQTLSSRIPIYPASVLVGIRPESWSFSKDSIAFQVAVADLSGRPVQGRPVEVDLYQQKTFSHRKRLVGGFYAYEHVRETSRIGAFCQGTTNDRGLIECRGEPPLSGNLILEAKVTDADGRPSSAHREIWVAGEEQWWFAVEDHDRIDLIPERPRYEAGETARFQVRMPFRQATALISVEREGIAEASIHQLSGTSPVIEIPVTGNFAPNVFVSALVVRGRVGDVQPTATVDLGKPAYKLGIAEIRVGWRPHELRVEVSADREVYPVRDTAHVKVAVRAAGGGSLPAGTEVALAAVDEGLLELMPNRSWEILEAMMGRRSYGVQTSTAQMQVVGKRHFGLKALPQGGGGGGQQTRELFDTLLLWKGRVALDAHGEARVDIPLNDSLTRFRIVAVATGGLDSFGHGAATIRTTQNLMLFSGIAPVVREGDRFESGFTVRNATESPMQVTVHVQLDPPGETRQEQVIELAPAESRNLQWTVVAPASVSWLEYRIEASADEGSRDAMTVRQRVVPVTRVETQQATLVQLEPAFQVAVARPAGALPGRGGIRVHLDRSLLSGLDAVRDTMQRYPYTCLEQKLSRAISLGDAGLWESLVRILPSYLDADGLLNYFPDDPGKRRGSDVLTAYLLAVSQEKGWSIPDELRDRMLGGLAGFVEGRIIRVSELRATDLAIRKLAALEALSRFGRATPAHLSTITIEPNLWPTSALIDCFNILHRLAGGGTGVMTIDSIEQILRSRLTFQGTVFSFSTEDRDRLWWLMVSNDVNAARLMLALLETGKWPEDMGRLVRGLLGRQQRGAWDLTTANAWGTLAVEKFARRFESELVAGITAVELAGAKQEVRWAAAGDSGPVDFTWPPGREELSLSHEGTGRPWATIQGRAAVPRNTSFWSGFQIEKEIQPVIQKSAGTWSAGDVMRVTLKVEAQSDMTWVVLDDPIPGGASILGSGLGRDSSLLTQDERGEGWVWPAFEERSFESFRAYYRFVRKGRWNVEYTVRVNNPGHFNLPATRVEALYFPEMFGELPNAPVEVRP